MDRVQDPDRLAPPAVSSLRRAEAAGSSMERTLSADIREEREELREAAEQTLNVIVDLNLDGTIRWVSPSWVDVIGTQTDTLEGTPIADLIIGDDKGVFADAIDYMKTDDSRSHFIRFTVYLGPFSKLITVNELGEPENSEDEPATVELEAQGIMVYDRATGGGESYSLGSGAEVLASYLTRLAESGEDDPANHPPPLPVLCRICERQIPPWWFEKHTDLCLQEHRAEMDVQMAQENLVEHRHSIVRVLDALEARKARPISGDQQTTLPIAEYKGLSIGPTSTTSSPGAASPVASSRDRSGTVGHHRSRSFAVRRPQARIVELLLDLCDTSIEVSTPAIKESGSQGSGEFRTQSPQSESRISQVLQWQSPGSNTLEQEQGLALLCADTERVAKEKVEAVFRYRRILEYTERIRVEFAVIVQDCIDEAMRKAARIAAGRLSDSTEGEDSLEDSEATPAATDEAIFAGSFDAPPSLALALKNADLEEPADRRRPSSIVGSTRSSSPRECSTPRSLRGGLSVAGQTRESRRESLMFESDAAESEGSVRSSSVMSRQPRTDSPISEFGGLRRATSSRQQQRRSLIIPGASSPHRQESPSRNAPPSSPLRILKPRSFQHSQDSIVSPEASPMLPHSEFGSPASIPHHHRRQSSNAFPEFINRHPPSPRMNPVNAAPQARANQVTNVKAERAIMMWQGESEFVAKLYWTFSSKDYLYLVMEYLNGGDCASLIKVLGGLPEDWVKKYLGEVILGVEHLHDRGIIHRDLKPDNLLIDQKGHLKLTDFGLSRMGLIGRQKRALNCSNPEQTPDLLKSGPFARSTSIASSRSASMDLHAPGHSPGTTPQMTPSDQGANLGQPSYFSLGSFQQEPRRISGHRSDSGGSETLTHMMNNFSLNDGHAAHAMHSRLSQSSVRSPHDDMSDGASVASPDLPILQPVNSHGSDHHHRSTPPQSSMMPPPMALFDPEDTNRRFVGTPDYLAPETINGERQDETSDWWSVGCILFEFLYGMPPFHATEAEHVFENILARKIMWPDEADFDVSPEAKDLINKLLCMDPRQRLGSNRDEKFASGGEEIRSHAWFEGVGWDTLLQDEAQFVPQPENPEDTEYFDSRGATLQAFTEEIEDQATPPSAPTPDYPDRPHDALSRVRSQVHVNSIKRGLMPLHIPPHIRDLKSRRLSEPMGSDDFGTFAFKNLTVLEKANKDVIQQLKAQAMAAQHRSGGSPGGSNNPTSPAPTLDGSPVHSMPVQRSLSNAKATHRPASPSSVGQAASSPSRASQPSSPLLVSFVAGQSPDSRRKPSSNKTTAVAPSPIKGRGAPPPLALSSPHKPVNTPRKTSNSSTRSRSLTVGSNEGSPVASDLLAHHRNRRSQVFDMSPSSSDNEGEKANALLRVQRRRQSSRRMSAINLDSPTFRSLDVLICEDHPVSRMVMEKLLEKLRCRTISASTGSEAVRYAMSEIKFDIIFTEFKLPEVSGADLARMVRELKNVNSHTPIVAITAYLKELQAPHYFDSLVEKPISSSKLIEVLSNLCQWKPPAPGQVTAGVPINHQASIPSVLKLESLRSEDSPTSGSSGYAQHPSSSFRGSSREDSISSSLFGDSESATTDDVPVPSNVLMARRSLEKLRSRRENLEKRRGEGSDSADDEDEELGVGRDRDRNSHRGKPNLPSSKLGIEMMRANSHDSVAVMSDNTITPEATTQVTTPSREGNASPVREARSPSESLLRTPPESLAPGNMDDDGDPDETPRPSETSKASVREEDPISRPTVKSSDSVMRMI
ncbi:Response regulator receiver rim15p [Apiospora saccharicola]